jgi:hypothetical protein
VAGEYLFEFNSSAAGQVTSSVRRVLSNEPNLKRYLVAMPLDMPAGDTEDRSSAYTRWTEKVSESEALADETTAARAAAPSRPIGVMLAAA